MSLPYLRLKLTLPAYFPASACDISVYQVYLLINMNERTEWSKKWQPVSFLPLTLSNLNRFAKFFHYVKEKEISNASHIIYLVVVVLIFFNHNFVNCKAILILEIKHRHTFNTLLHYLVKLVICSNMMQIRKKMKAKCINFACTACNLSSLVYLLLTYLLPSFLVSVQYFK